MIFRVRVFSSPVDDITSKLNRQIDCEAKVKLFSLLVTYPCVFVFRFLISSGGFSRPLQGEWVCAHPKNQPPIIPTIRVWSGG